MNIHGSESLPPRHPEPARIPAGAAALDPLFPASRLRTASSLRAEELIARAEAEVARAREEAERIKAEARAEARGLLEAARADATRACADDIRRCLESILASAQHAERRQAEALAAYVFPVAAAVLGAELELSPERFAAVVAGALRSCRGSGERVRLTLHPDDAHPVREYLASSGEQADLDVVENPSARRFSAQLETPDGFYEGGVEARLRLLEDAARRAVTEGHAA